MFEKPFPGRALKHAVSRAGRIPLPHGRGPDRAISFQELSELDFYPGSVAFPDRIEKISFSNRRSRFALAKGRGRIPIMAGRHLETPMTAAERWGLRPGSRVWLGGNNVAARGYAETLLPDVVRPPEGPLDVALITPSTADEAVYFAQKLLPRLSAEGRIWIVYPFRGSARDGEFQGSVDELAVDLFRAGLEESGTSPVGPDYTSAGFRPTEPAF